MTTPSTVLVLGAHGTVGSALVPDLQARGITVRTLIRDAAKSVGGAENVVGDLADDDAVTTALDGVDAAFLNRPSAENAAALQTRFADLAQQAGVKRLVVLSQYAASPDSPVRFLRWHADVEQHVRRIGLAATILRPNLYLQSLLGLRDTIAQGWFGAPIAEAAVSAIDTRDVAAAAAAALADPATAGRTYTLTGPRAITHAQIAEALSAAIGRPIAFKDVPPEQFAAALDGVLPPWQIAGLIEDYAHYARGEAGEVHTGVQDLTGRPARDVTQFATDHAAAFSAR
jgi:uncharacterized protein YbjT (DUF2867 family)